MSSLGETVNLTQLRAPVRGKTLEPYQASPDTFPSTDVTVSDTEAAFRSSRKWAETSVKHPLAMGCLEGMALSNAADADHDITVSAGRRRDASNTYNLELTSALTKQIDAAWAVGTDAGGLFTGTVQADTTYHFFVIYNPTTGVVDAGWDTSLTAANKPSGFTAYRRLGSYATDGSANLRKTRQRPDMHTFDLDVPIQIVSAYATSRTTVTITGLPTGISFGLNARYQGNGGVVVSVYGLITSPDETDTAPNSSLFDYFGSVSDASAIFIVKFTNTMAQICHRESGTGANLEIYFDGWWDPLGVFDYVV